MRSIPAIIFSVAAVLYWSVGPGAVGALQAAPLALTNERGSVSLTTAGVYFVDTDGDLTLPDIVKLPPQSWRSTDDEYLNLGTNSDVGWLFARVSNHSDSEDRLLVWEYPWGDRAEVFVFDESRRVSRSLIGIDVPIDDRIYRHRIPVVRLTLPPGSQRDIYVRIESTGTKVARFYIDDLPDFLHRDQRHAFSFYLFLGVFALMLVLNILLARATRSVGPLYYALVLLFYGLNVALFRDYLTEALFASDPVWKYRFTYILSPLMAIAVIAFWRWLLLLPVHAPRVDRALILVMPVMAAIAGMALLPEPDFLFLNSFGKQVFYVEGALLIAAAALAVRRGFYPAFYSLSGLLFLQGSIVAYLLATSDALPMNVWTEHVLYLGLIPEFAFFMLSVFKRTRLLETFHPAGEEATEKQRIAAYRRHIRKGAGRYKKSKVIRINTEETLEQLSRLMNEEKLFCDEDLSLARLAHILSITPYQLSEIINANYNKNFFRFLNEYRIAEARKLLRIHPKRPIAAIARSVGFASLSSFNTEFKRATGTTPSRFRRDAAE